MSTQRLIDQFQQYIDRSLILEEAERGRGIPVFGKMKDILKKVGRTVQVDYLNMAPPEAEFSLMNFYTLDIRLNEQAALKAMQSGLETYVASAKEALDNNMLPNNEEIIKQILKETYIGKQQEVARKAASALDYQRVKKGMQESVFDITVDNLYLLTEKMSLMDAKLGNDVIAYNKIDVGNELTYINQRNEKVPVIVTALPRELNDAELEELGIVKDKATTAAGALSDAGLNDDESPYEQTPASELAASKSETYEKTGKIAPGYIQIKQGNGNPYAAPIIRDGKISLDGLKPPPEEGADGVTQAADGVTQAEELDDNPDWNPDWDTMSLEELKNVDELKKIFNDMPPFFVGSPYETGKAAIPDFRRFAYSIANALESSFRGSVKNGVTLEEIYSGKFGKKLTTPEKGAFINKIKDPTSEQPIDFRSFSEEDLEKIHNVIMHTFSKSDLLKRVPVSKSADMGRSATSQEDPSTPTNSLKGLILYMEQDDFDRFSKGGQGFSKLAKGAASQLSQAAALGVVNI